MFNLTHKHKDIAIALAVACSTLCIIYFIVTYQHKHEPSEIQVPVPNVVYEQRIAELELELVKQHDRSIEMYDYIFDDVTPLCVQP